MSKIFNFEKIIEDDKLLKQFLNSTTNKKNLHKLSNKLKKMKNNKNPLLIKLCLHPCSGKTYFYRLMNGYYRGIFIYDFDCWNFGSNNRSRRALKGTYKSHICLIGCYEQPKQDNIIDISIIIPYNYLSLFHKKRTQTPNRKGQWSILENILGSRTRLIKESYKNNIPMFGSINQALDFVIKVYKTGKYKL